MVGTPGPEGWQADGFADELLVLEARIDELRRKQRSTGGDLGQLLQELETAREELRVADEEVRTQQDELDRLVQSQRLDRWQHDRVLAVMPAPVIVTDGHGVIHTVNASAASLLRRRVDRMLRKPLQAFVDSADRRLLRSELSQAVVGRHNFSVTVSLLPRDAEPVKVELAASVSLDPWSETVQVTWLAHGDALDSPSIGLADSSGALPRALVELTQLPLHSRSTHKILNNVARICQRALGESFAVSVIVGEPASPDVLATSSKLAQNADGAQLLADEGPCRTAWETKALVTSPDLACDQRWPRLAQHLQGTAVRCAVATPIQVGDDLAGVLNAYGGAGAGVDDRLARGVELMGTAVAAILHEMDLKVELESLASQLQHALDSRPTIEQAKGIVMATRGCGPDAAFEYLADLSSRSNLKLRDIAARIVERAARDPHLYDKQGDANDDAG